MQKGHAVLLRVSSLPVPIVSSLFRPPYNDDLVISNKRWTETYEKAKNNSCCMGQVYSHRKRNKATLSMWLELLLPRPASAWIEIACLTPATPGSCLPLHFASIPGTQTDQNSRTASAWLNLSNAEKLPITSGGGYKIARAKQRVHNELCLVHSIAYDL